jgi:hypothetical protein
MIGYKALKKDLKCRGFQYEVGKTYEIDGKIELCKRGFHFCKNISDCFRYYGQSDALFAKIEALGEVIQADDDSKCVTNKIKILEEIPREEAVIMSNSGNRNSGNWNSGNWNSGCGNSGNLNSGDWNSGCGNSGNWNSGDWNSGNGNSGCRNSGNRNSGNRNSGNWNSGDWNISSYNNGCFMSVKPIIMMFNKPTDWTIEDWWNSKARDIMQNCPVDYTGTVWVSSGQMTDEERSAHPSHKVTGGYLKIVKHKADRQTWWDLLSADDKQTVMSLPNFDADVFCECTGIRAKAEVMASCCERWEKEKEGEG